MGPRSKVKSRKFEPPAPNPLWAPPSPRTVGGVSAGPPVAGLVCVTATSAHTARHGRASTGPMGAVEGAAISAREHAFARTATHRLRRVFETLALL